MPYFFIFFIFIVGASGIVAQVLILRELLVAFYGNELTIGIILANWILCESLGAAVVGKVIDKVRDKINVFINLEIVFAIALPVCVYAARAFKTIAGISYPESVGLYTVFFAALLINAVIGFCHGAAFSSGCRIYHNLLFPVKTQPAQVSQQQGSVRGIGNVYVWETLGTVFGGIVLTYFFIPRFNSFQTAYVVSFINVLMCILILPSLNNRKKAVAAITACVALFIAFLTIRPAFLQKKTFDMLYPNARVLDYRNSVYANIAVTQAQGQRVFFYNGIPAITVEYPDITFVEEFGCLPLLFHPDPKDVLVIAGGAGGLIGKVLMHPVNRLDYAELDPLLIEMVRKYPSSLTERELNDPRVNTVTTDGRFFLNTTANLYDVILVGVSDPADLTTNRLFTEEFFLLVKEKLKPAGVFAFHMPGSLTYLSPQLRDLNFCVLNALKSSFPSVRVIPGDYNMYVASAAGDLNQITVDELTRRLTDRRIRPAILSFDYLDYRLHPRHYKWFMESSVQATDKVNRDFSPFAVYQTIVLWNKKFSRPLASVFESLKAFDLKSAFFLAVLIPFAFFWFGKGNHKGVMKRGLFYTIAATGFFSMLINLIFIFGFQVTHGYLYYKIGLFIAVFMLGIACAGILVTGYSESIKNKLGVLLRVETGIIAFSLITGLFIYGGNTTVFVPGFVYFILFFITGVLTGAEFPLANSLYLKQGAGIGRTAGFLYSADLAGGWIAGVLGGVFLVPVMGLLQSCMVIVFFKVSSFVFLLVLREGSAVFSSRGEHGKITKS